MAKNTGMKRIPTKYVRDRAKAAYEKQDSCYICGTNNDLELHHTHSITRLLESWAAKKGYDINSDEGILAVRDEFIEEHHKELYDDVFTLCNKHHVALHGVYGKSPSNYSAPRQKSWLDIQKAKFVPGFKPQKVASFFSDFT